MHQSFAISPLAHNDGTVVVLQGTGGNLRRRGRTVIDENDQRNLSIYRQRHGFEDFVFRFLTASGLHNLGTARQEVRHHFYGLLHHTAAIAAKVEHQSADAL